MQQGMCQEGVLSRLSLFLFSARSSPACFSTSLCISWCLRLASSSQCSRFCLQPLSRGDNRGDTRAMACRGSHIRSGCCWTAVLRHFCCCLLSTVLLLTFYAFPYWPFRPSLLNFMPSLQTLHAFSSEPLCFLNQPLCLVFQPFKLSLPTP